MEELLRKRKYIPDTETETQYDDVEIVEQTYFEQNSQTYDDVWESHLENINESVMNKSLKDKRTEKTMKDCATCTENTMADVKHDVMKVVDIHSCKYFGQFVSNELLRFNVEERYVIKQKIIETLKK